LSKTIEGFFSIHSRTLKYDYILAGRVRENTVATLEDILLKILTSNPIMKNNAPLSQYMLHFSKMQAKK